MSDKRTDAEQRALDAVSKLGEVRAPDSVRSAAHRAFMQGQVSEAQTPSADAIRRSLAQDLPDVVTRKRSPWAMVLPLAAALAVVAGGWWGARPAELWTVTDVVAREGVGLQNGCGNPGEHVHEGRIEVGQGSELEIQLGHDLRVRLLEGTVVELPDGPGRWFGGNTTMRVLSGEVFGTTKGPLDYAFHFATDEAEATLTGTTFAVFRTGDTTCFCLYEGSLDITSAGSPVSLEPGNRVFLYSDRRDPKPQPLPAREVMKLTMMKNAGILDELPVHP